MIAVAVPTFYPPVLLMPLSLVITTGARLHFGMLALSSTAARRFGGVGLMVDRPGFQVRFSDADQDLVVGPESYRDKAAEFLSAFRETNRFLLPPTRIEIVDAPPPHVGFGSGTQLGMAVAQGLALRAGEGTLSTQELAARVGRGARSALGVHGFAQGGLLVEAGKRDANTLAPLVCRLAFPAAWRFVLIRPPTTRGLSGAEEREAFASLPPMPAATTAELCEIVLLRLLPAVVEEDIAAFGEALFQFGRIVGECFAAAQGGATYADPEMSRLAAHLRQQGRRGIAQTSWGPTLCVLIANEAEAAELTHELRQSEWAACDLLNVAPLNTGAAIACGVE